MLFKIILQLATNQSVLVPINLDTMSHSRTGAFSSVKSQKHSTTFTIGQHTISQSHLLILRYQRLFHPSQILSMSFLTFKIGHIEPFIAFKKLSGIVLEFPLFAIYEIQCPNFAFLLNLLHPFKDIKKDSITSGRQEL